ncbi:hypothetical protein [Cecembia lonarensis]|uniref:Tetratricopeptide repeat protein n=1 Tax=Cecembia lonarensis (strain CCUG 58316 / KCTC 22772 / LW9) TaxID=1225176 RepID=K1L305_CECL9|nr:hypothetical protein [Cecembia lonarensis]EKB50745.1 hypothetical protein B879_00725 [Cecembia lonarensis LW9]
MNPLQLLGIIQHANHLSKDDFTELLKLHEAFPYFQIPKVLLAKYEFDKSNAQVNELLHWAAITSPDRVWLRKMVETKVPFETREEFLKKKLIEVTESKKAIEGKNLIDDLEGQLIPENKKVTSTKDLTATLKKLGEDLAQSKIKALEKLEKGNIKQDPSQEVITPEETTPKTPPVETVKIKPDKTQKPENKSSAKNPKRRVHKDELIESIKKKEKKEILDKKKLEQIDIIKAFSKKEIKLATIKEIEGQQRQEDLSENSTKLNPSLITEAYAGILVKQGKKVKAKEIYKKLMVKFPEKNTYFANLIERLEKTN